MKYYLSTIADVDFNVVEETEEISYVRHTAPVAKEYGIGLELAEFCISENLDEKFEAVLPHFEFNRNEIKDVVLHAPYNELMPHAVDPLVADAARKRYEWTWELCKKYGINKMVVHANYVHVLYYPQWFIARQIEFWKDFLKDRPENIEICLENVMEPYPSMLTDIIKGVGDERFKMCLDVGHANLMEIKPMQWLKECAPYIGHYHIHNNDGPAEGDRPSLGDRHRGLGNGNIDMKALLLEAERLTPDATASVESYEIEESAQWLRDNGFIQRS